jgi:GNAT superfamily N-acetyltransferase
VTEADRVTPAAGFSIRTAGWDHPGGEALRDAQREEIRAVFYPEMENSEPGPPPSADDITVYYLAFDGDRPIGSGGLRAIDAGHGEIKRMYVAPAYRGTGVAADILHALEDDARARGWTRLVLETGDRMLAAQRFYERNGYAPIPAFGHYIGSSLSLCFEKVLAPK